MYGKRDALWKFMTPEQVRYVTREFESTRHVYGEPDEPPVLLKNVPVDAFAVNEESLARAAADNRRGAGSRTRGPLAVRYDPDKNTFFLIDGHHRLAAAIRAKKPTVNVMVVGSGYSDYYATPRDED